MSADCPHRDVIPVLPVWIDPKAPSWATVDGICGDCGDGPFTMWEAYGYGNAAHEDPWPTPTEVLEDFEAWWTQLRSFGAEVMALEPPVRYR